MGVGTSFTLGGIGHDALATNKLVEASMVFGHGLSSLVGGAVNVVADVALGMGFLPPGTFLWDWGFLEFSFGPDCIPPKVLGWV